MNRVNTHNHIPREKHPLMAGRIPEQFIDDLLVRADIVDVIDRRVPLKKAGKDYKACCPFHEEKTASFTVSAEKQFYHCFGCGAHGTAIGFLMEYDHLPFPEAVEELASSLGMDVPREGGGQAGPAASDTPELLDILNEADLFYRKQLRTHPDAQEAVDYLKGRGLTGEIAADFGIGYAPDAWDALVTNLGTSDERLKLLEKAGLATSKQGGGFYDRFRHRIMFPIHDYRGRVVGFGGRLLPDRAPTAQGNASAAGDKKSGAAKYLNSPETPVFHKGREMYGLFRAREAIKNANRVLVVEGYMDVVALAQNGVRNVVATLGTATTPDHLERLFRHAPEVIFCFDGDRAGRQAAWRALEQSLPLLRSGRLVSFLFLPEGEDPDSMIRAEGQAAFEQRMAGVMPLPEFLMEELAAKVDLGRADGQARFAELARPLLQKVPAGVFREILMEMLEKKAGLGQDKLSKSLNLDKKPPSTASGRVSAGRRQQPPFREDSLQGLVRQAITMLLQNPQLAPYAGDYQLLSALDWRGLDLLREMLEIISREPGLNQARVLERYRETEYFPHLQKLAARQHLPGDVDMQAEFSGIFDQMRNQSARARFQLLYNKGQDSLTEQEKEEFKKLRQIIAEVGIKTTPDES
jgi:DNA primase